MLTVRITHKLQRLRSALRAFVLPALLAVAATAYGQDSQNTAAHRHFYVDCSNSASAQTGTDAQAPWTNIDQLNAHQFRAGDVIAFKRGTVCNGSLAPRGSGSEDAPIRLTAYGAGVRPKIVAPASADQALRLFNQQFWDIDSLDLSGGQTHGILISGDHGILHHIYLENLAVHGVEGKQMRHKESGLVAITPQSANEHFDDVLVDNVTAWNTNQWVGILVGGGNLGYPPEEDWSSKVVIRNSAIHDVQGDGIVLFRVRKGIIENSVAWNTGMQDTQSIGTPNAIWTWMCDDCVVRNSEAYLTDSPGVDGGAFDIDYGNTKNSVLDNYGHDTQGYCVAVFGAGFVTRDSVVRGNLCINNGRSPRMADYQGAIFLLTWNGGSIDTLTIENNTVYWSPFERAPALLNDAAIRPGTAVFRNNTIDSTSPWLADSNALLALRENHYSYFGAGAPEWRYGHDRFENISQLQSKTRQEANSSYRQQSLDMWPLDFASRPDAQRNGSAAQAHSNPINALRLTCTLPVSLDDHGLLKDEALQQIVVLKSFAQQYSPQGLKITLRLSADRALFETEAYRNAITDLDLHNITVEQITGTLTPVISLTTSDRTAPQIWHGFIGPATLGLALRQLLGEPVYAQMGAPGQ